MNDYWTKRAAVNRAALIELMLLTDQDALLAKWGKLMVFQKTSDQLALKFNEFLGEVIDALELSSDHAPALVAAREMSISKLNEGLPNAHCEKCERNPNSPKTFEEHLSFADERSVDVLTQIMGSETDSLVFRLKTCLIIAVRSEGIKALGGMETIH